MCFYGVPFYEDLNHKPYAELASHMTWYVMVAIPYLMDCEEAEACRVHLKQLSLLLSAYKWLLDSFIIVRGKGRVF